MEGRGGYDRKALDFVRASATFAREGVSHDPQVSLVVKCISSAMVLADAKIRSDGTRAYNKKPWEINASPIGILDINGRKM